MNTHWKTTVAGILTGVTLLSNGLILPLLEGIYDRIDISGIIAGLGAFGIGWFASDKPKLPKNDDLFFENFDWVELIDEDNEPQKPTPKDKK